MQKNIREICIDVCNYKDEIVCNLFDSAHDTSGQAVEVFVKHERNGFKELRFKLPSTCTTENGEEKNYRLDFLISDYRIRLLTKKADNKIEIDWFLISETKVTHSAFSNDYEVRAGHISQLLRTKNLDLEFSDTEGNNTGTIEEIARTILEGTGWHLGECYRFYEEDKFLNGGEIKEKVRSFTSQVRTGAFKMMTDLCEMFDAKPVYHGWGEYSDDGPIWHGELKPAETKWGRTIDILPINPFSKDLEQGAVPKEVMEGENVLELYYDKNIKDITRTLNTENLCTKLTARGAFGELATGYCGLNTAKHMELIFNQALTKNTEYSFVYLDGFYYFTPTVNTASGQLRWSYLDFLSRSYMLYNDNLFKVYREPQTSNPTRIEDNNISYEEVQNYLTAIMDFSYYQKIGLLTDAQWLELARYQRDMPQLHINAEKASAGMSEANDNLVRIASTGGGLMKLNISESKIHNGHLQLTLNKTEDYPDGVIYRSDYMESKRNYFTLNAAKYVKKNNVAVGASAVVYIIHQGNPTKWEKSYVKCYGNGTVDYYRDALNNIYKITSEDHYNKKERAQSDPVSVTQFPPTGVAGVLYVADLEYKYYVWNETEYTEVVASMYYYDLKEFDEPDTVTLWLANDTWHAGDQVYLFSSDSIAGMFGPREDAVISNRQSLETTLKHDGTQVHPVEFVIDSETPTEAISIAQADYGWYYRSKTNTFSFGELYFCWGAKGDLGWKRVYVSRGNEDPEVNPGAAYNSGTYGYYYHKRRRMFYRPDNTLKKWVSVNDTSDDKRVTSDFGTVINGCITYETLMKGTRKFLTHSDPVSTPGNYLFVDEFDRYWIFTTTKATTAETGLVLHTDDNSVWQDGDPGNIVKASIRTFDLIEFNSRNMLTETTFNDKKYSGNGVIDVGETHRVSNSIQVHENVWYSFSLPSQEINNTTVKSIVACYTRTNEFLQSFDSSPFITPEHTSYVKIICPRKPNEEDPKKSDPTSSHYFRVNDFTSSCFINNDQYTILSSVGSGDREGLPELMDDFISYADEAYLIKLPQLRNAQNEITRRTTNLMEALDDMYREGWWQEDKYVESNESQLYADALDNLKEISHPQATYEFTYLDLYGSERGLGLSTNEDLEEIEWPDIEITDAAHLVDMDIDTNCWAYIDMIDKCYDQPWKTQIEINTNLSMIGQQSFADVLARIAEVANEVKANQTLYKRAAVLTGSGKLAAERLEGAILANRLYILGGTSNWYTDDKGNIIFESADGQSAMMLSGRGWMVANSKDAYGDWNWRVKLWHWLSPW